MFGTEKRCKHAYLGPKMKHEGPVIDTVDDINVIDCNTCGFKHVTPLPSEEELNAFYEKEYYNKDKPQYLRDSEEDAEWWEMTYAEYFHLFENYCSKETAKVLEIGSGPGLFLKCGKERGWNLTGIEPSKQAFEYSLQFGAPVINAFFSEESAQTLGTFDIIFMDTLLEHIADPIALIQLAKSILNKKGLLCIISPNDYNPLQKILREKKNYAPWWVVPHHHLNYFDFQSIQNLLTSQGFTIKEKLGTFPIEFFLLCGDNYIGNRQLGREVHAKRKQFEKNLMESNPELLKAFYQSLGKQGVGRSFVVLAQH